MAIETALIAVASVSAVVWTGGFIARSWQKQTKFALMIAMDSLQFAFFAPLGALLAPNASVMRIIASAFLLIYSAALAFNVMLYKRQQKAGKFGPYYQAVEEAGFFLWLAFQIGNLLPIAVVVALPYPVIVGWVSFGLLFIGYQIMLMFLYRDLIVGAEE